MRSSPDKYAVMRKTFGYDGFREGQEEIIDAILDDQDVFVIRPTGGGKSACYQIPAVMRDQPTLVVCPLISLMRDQVGGLVERGVNAHYICSEQDPADKSAAFEAMQNGSAPIIYVSPERLQNGSFLESVASVPFGTLVADEAHCISEWGHDFRPRYGEIGQFVKRKEIAQVLAFTATASRMVEADIKGSLGMKDPFEYKADIYRPNLEYGVHKASTQGRKIGKVKSLIEEHAPADEDAVIIYCATRRNTQEVCKSLKKKGVDCDFYHAGIDAEERGAVEKNFMSGKTKVLVATNAFGMGVDKANIRLVIHFDVPGKVQAYLQESGRAGRDGESAYCALIYNEADLDIQRYFLDQRSPDTRYVKQVYQALVNQRDKLGRSKKSDSLSKSGYFVAHLPSLYNTMHELENKKLSSKGSRRVRKDNTKVNAAIGILEEHGILERWTNYVRLKPFTDNLTATIRASIKRRRQIATASLEQVIRYTSTRGSDRQRMLVDMMDQDLAA